MTTAPIGRLTGKLSASWTDSSLSRLGLTVKAPPPAYIRRKRSTKQRPDNTRDTHSCANSAHPRRPLLQRNRIDHEDHSSVHKSCGAHTRDRSPDDESHRVWCGAAYRGTDLEDDDERQVDVFWRVEGVDAAEEQCGAAGCEEEGASVPADLVEGIEFVCEGW